MKTSTRRSSILVKRGSFLRLSRIGFVSYLLLAIGTLSVIPTTRAADRIKINNTDNLNLGSSWTGGVPSRDHMAVWTNAVTGANSSLLGGNVNWQGIRIANPGGLVTILARKHPHARRGGGRYQHRYERRHAGSDDPVGAHDQGRRRATVEHRHGAYTSRLIPEPFTRGAGATLLVQGAGSVVTTMPNLNSGSLVNGLIGPWAIIGTGTSASYATINGSDTIVAYTGGTGGCHCGECHRHHRTAKLRCRRRRRSWSGCFVQYPAIHRRGGNDHGELYRQWPSSPPARER